MSFKTGAWAASIVLAAWAVAPQALAAGEALTKRERAMLSEPGRAEQAIAARIDAARNAAAVAQQNSVSEGDASKAERDLRRIHQELEKARRALESGDYRAAYAFAGRAQILAMRAAEVR